MRPKRTITQRFIDSEPQADRFWSKVAIGSSDDCWPYTGHRDHSGYGRFEVFSEGHPAHRVAWALAHGETAPAGLSVLHQCDNPPCCNPVHLFLGTQTDNMQDRKAKGRNPDLRGQGNGRAVLTEQDVRSIRSRWDNGERSLTAMGKTYGVTPTAIYEVVRRRSWKHVT